jgi:precorrin-6A/cobalt-precorrin-6A reductase
VILIRRPDLPDAPTVATVDEAVAWIDHRGRPGAAARGV